MSSPPSRTVESPAKQCGLEANAIRGLSKHPGDRCAMYETSAGSIGWLLAKPRRASSCATPRRPQARLSEVAEAGLRVVEASGAQTAREWRPREEDGASSRLAPLARRSRRTGPSAWEGPDDEESMQGAASGASIAPVPGEAAPRPVPRCASREPQGIVPHRTWRRPKRLCDETRYSEAYWKMLHHNPFCKRDAGR